MTRCKVICEAVTKRKWSAEEQYIYESEFTPVTTGSDENKQFFASTPTGSLKLGVLRNDQFTPGKEYYVDFTQVDDACSSARSINLAGRP